MQTAKKTTSHSPENLQEKFQELKPDVSSDSESPSTTTNYQSGSTMVKFKAVNLIAVLVPFIGFVAAIILLWGTAFNLIYLAIL